MTNKKKPKKSTKKLPALSDCPFCGGDAKQRQRQRDHWVVCLKCGALGPFTKSKTAAVDAWNQREFMITTG
mgnify:CR=1 FL=1|jgi:Lar family restriction alleviation protein|tara:strand:- start:518 stop:730 length:213 start_codon:yes stop_codon:yes gene_type:complete